MTPEERADWIVELTGFPARRQQILTIIREAVAEEREECAKICDWFGGRDAEAIAKAIRESKEGEG